MPRFSNRSETALVNVHNDLARVMRRAILTYDFVIICGWRDRAAQEAAYKGGFSKAKFGQSPHNFTPALAVDIVPYPKFFEAPVSEFRIMAGHVKAAADHEGVPLDWGGDWQRLKDYPHFELKGWRALSQKAQLV